MATNFDVTCSIRPYGKVYGTKLNLSIELIALENDAYPMRKFLAAISFFYLLRNL